MADGGPPAPLPHPGHRPAWASVDLGAIRHNLAAVASVAAGARLWAVVKADAYGHGAVPVATAVLAAGAAGLAVALVEEGVALRDAGIAAPVLLLSEPPPAAMADAVARGLTATVYSQAGVAALARAAAATGARRPVAVHLKVDTGMHRVGARPEAAAALARSVAAEPGLALEGVWTHLAVADDPAQAAYTAGQLAAFDRACAAVTAAGAGPFLRHAANSAGVLTAGAALDGARPGIALYGYRPNPDVPVPVELRPALSLVARVAHVQEREAGDRLSYGLRYRLADRSTVATVPLGYADGVRRRLSETGGEALVGGRRRPIAGTVTMDQILVDCGPGAAVAVGDEVVLLGRQGDHEITAEDWAARLGTISYEILTGIGPRVPRVYRP